VSQEKEGEGGPIARGEKHPTIPVALKGASCAAGTENVSFSMSFSRRRHREREARLTKEKTWKKKKKTCHLHGKSAPIRSEGGKKFLLQITGGVFITNKVFPYADEVRLTRRPAAAKEPKGSLGEKERTFFNRASTWGRKRKRNSHLKRRASTQGGEGGEREFSRTAH